jgi:hypothetical protein
LGTNTPKPPADATANTPGGKFGLLLIIGALSGAMIGTAGCAASPQTVAYRAAMTGDVSVEAAIQVYNSFAKAGKTTVAQNDAVKAAYIKYQRAFDVLCDAGEVYAAADAGSVAAYQQAAIGFAQSAQDVKDLLASFNLKL